jgi:hypothetical protein
MSARHRAAPRPFRLGGIAPAILLAAALGTTTPAAAAAQPVPAARDSGAFVTRLGADTLVVERFARAGQRVTAEVVLRVPRTTRTRYLLDLSPDGELARLEAVALDPRTGAPTGAAPDRLTRAGDSLRVELTGAGGRHQLRTVAAPRGVLPFIDMVHWPFELVLARARQGRADSVVQPLLTGTRVAEFGVARLGADSMTITHPFRGTMRTRVDTAGRLLGLDAGATTRKLRVERVSAAPLAALARRWSAEDAAGRSPGALSGRAEAAATIRGATVSVDYGTPVRRGRAIWGALVPWGTVWRTGANEATHLATTADLVLGTGRDTLAVPAGRYTLFSIPERTGGVLIVNRQTGQTGTSYDAARDLGRVPLTARALPSSVERFTIVVDEAGAGGWLRLQWERTELVVPFAVRPR